MPGSIGRQTTSYRQGLVLGLTMAEIMLLLVFSLLIAIGVSLASERDKRAGVIERLRASEAATAKANAVVDQIKRNPRLSELLTRSAKAPVSAAKVDEFWRTLVESDDIVVAMERRGVSRTALRESGDYFAKMQQLKKSGFDPDSATRGEALAAAIEEAVPKEIIAGKTPEQIAALIVKGASVTEVRNEGGPKDGHTWPPIINLSEAEGYFFATRSAELRPEFEAVLRTTVVEKLLDPLAEDQAVLAENHARGWTHGARRRRHHGAVSVG